MELIVSALSSMLDTAGDVLPVVVFLLIFQTTILRRRIPHLGRMVVGFGFVVAGLGLFLLGLERGLFPLWRLMAEQLTSASMMPNGQAATHWLDYYWVYAFALAIGFSTTLAEPTLLAVAIKANEASGGAIHIGGLRVAVALGVSICLALGCCHIVSGTPLHWYIICRYSVVIL